MVLVQIVNAKGEMKGSAITGPVGKEAAELWPVCSPCLPLVWCHADDDSVLPPTPVLSCKDSRQDGGLWVHMIAYE